MASQPSWLGGSLHKKAFAEGYFLALRKAAGFSDVVRTLPRSVVPQVLNTAGVLADRGQQIVEYERAMRAERERRKREREQQKRIMRQRQLVG